MDGHAIRRRGHELWPAFGDLVRRYGISREILDEMIAGQRQDLEAAVIGTFEDLHQYCYRVARVVGLASISACLGMRGDEATEELAKSAGVAFQLTNVLRDLREDAGKGRCYVPTEEMERVWGDGGGGWRRGREEAGFVAR